MGYTPRSRIAVDRSTETPVPLADRCWSFWATVGNHASSFWQAITGCFRRGSTSEEDIERGAGSGRGPNDVVGHLSTGSRHNLGEDARASVPAVLSEMAISSMPTGDSTYRAARFSDGPPHIAHRTDVTSAETVEPPVADVEGSRSVVSGHHILRELTQEHRYADVGRADGLQQNLKPEVDVLLSCAVDIVQASSHIDISNLSAHWKFEQSHPLAFTFTFIAVEAAPARNAIGGMGTHSRTLMNKMDSSATSDRWEFASDATAVNSDESVIESFGASDASHSLRAMASDVSHADGHDCSSDDFFDRVAARRSEDWREQQPIPLLQLRGGGGEEGEAVRVSFTVERTEANRNRPVSMAEVEDVLASLEPSIGAVRTPLRDWLHGRSPNTIPETILPAQSPQNSASSSPAARTNNNLCVFHFRPGIRTNVALSQLDLLECLAKLTELHDNLENGRRDQHMFTEAWDYLVQNNFLTAGGKLGDHFRQGARIGLNVPWDTSHSIVRVLFRMSFDELGAYTYSARFGKSITTLRSALLPFNMPVLVIRTGYGPNEQDSTADEPEPGPSNVNLRGGGSEVYHADDEVGQLNASCVARASRVASMARTSKAIPVTKKFESVAMTRTSKTVAANQKSWLCSNGLEPNRQIHAACELFFSPLDRSAACTIAQMQGIMDRYGKLNSPKLEAWSSGYGVHIDERVRGFVRSEARRLKREARSKVKRAQRRRDRAMFREFQSMRVEIEEAMGSLCVQFTALSLPGGEGRGSVTTPLPSGSQSIHGL